MIIYLQLKLGSLHDASTLYEAQISWAEEESSVVSLEEPLEMLLELMIDRLDLDNNGELLATEVSTTLRIEAARSKRTKL